MKRRAPKRTHTITADGVRVELEEEGGFVHGDTTTEELIGNAQPLSELRNKRVQPDLECWGCIHDFRRQDNPHDDPDVAYMWDEYYRHRSGVPMDRLVEILEAAFIEKVYNKGVAAGECPIMWDKVAIERHLTHHMVDFETDIAQTIQMLNTVAQEAASRIYTQDADGTKYLNKSQFEVFHKSLDVKHKYCGLLRAAKR